MNTNKKMLALTSLSLTLMTAQADRLQHEPTVQPAELSHIQMRQTSDGRQQIVTIAGGQECVMGSVSIDANIPMPDNMKTWLKQVEKAAAWVDEHPGQKMGAARANGRVIQPLLGGIMWDQTAPFDLYCPTNTPVGCVATALAQVMYYWRYPEHGYGQHSYQSNTLRQWLSADFGKTYYKWDLMFDRYEAGKYNASQREAVAQLSYHCGVALDMDYAYVGSGTYTEFIPNAAHAYFGYNSKAGNIYRSHYTYEEWDERITAELEAGRPVIFSADNTEVGHAFVIDGRNAEGLFHVNWGWSGYYNDYFDIGILNPDGAGTGGSVAEYGYSFTQSALIQFCPEEGVGDDISPVTLQNLWQNGLNAQSLKLGMYVDNRTGIQQHGLIATSLIDANGNCCGETSFGYTQFSAFPQWGSTLSSRCTLIPDGLADGTYTLGVFFKSCDNNEMEAFADKFPEGFARIPAPISRRDDSYQVKDGAFVASATEAHFAFECTAFNYSDCQEFAVNRIYDFTYNVTNTSDATFVGQFSLNFIRDADNPASNYIYEKYEETNLHLAPGESIELHFPVTFKQADTWDVFLTANDYGQRTTFAFETARVVSALTDESPGVLTLAETPQLLTERCEANGNVQFRLVVNNLEGGNFAGSVAMRVFATKAATGNCYLTIGEDHTIASNTTAQEIILNGKLTSLRANSRYYAVPCYQDQTGEYTFMYKHGSTAIVPIELKVYAASAGIEDVKNDATGNGPAYDLMGRRMTPGVGGFKLTRCGIAVGHE